MNIRRASATFLTVLAVVTTAGLGAANAANLGTKPGNFTKACDVVWKASAIIDVDGSPDVPNDLMQDSSGAPVSSYSNGGFSQSVLPSFNDPGHFEVQHWVQNWMNTGGATTVNFRYYIGTDFAVSGAKLTVNLPALPEGSGMWSVSDGSSWGARYAKAIGEPYSVVGTPQVPTGMINSGESVIDLGDFAAQGIETIQFTAVIPASAAHDTFVGSGQMTGLYEVGAGCSAPAVVAGPKNTPTATPQTSPVVAAPAAAPVPVAPSVRRPTSLPHTGF